MLQDKQRTAISLVGRGITHIQPEIAELSKLQLLNLNMNSLHEVPRWVWELPELKEMSLIRNQIEALNPDDVKLASKLQKLDLGVNPIGELPATIVELPNLTSLDLARTGLRRIPEIVFDMAQLQQLNFSRNHSGIISPNIRKLSRLERLVLQNISASRLPDEVGKLKALEELDLKSCRNLTELPGSVGQLKALKHLDISHTGLSRLPAGLADLPQLRTLHAIGCSQTLHESIAELNLRGSVNVFYR